MKKIIFSAIFITLAFVLIASGVNHKRFMVEKPGPDVFDQMTPSAATEIAIAEQVAQKRLAYYKELQKLESFYKQSGNQLKIEWVQRELAGQDAAPRYRYLLQAEVAGDSLKATDSIPKADILYEEVLDILNRTDVIVPIPVYVKHKKPAFPAHLPLFVSKKKMQRALNKCNELISDYPSSDKIDDAAYMAGEVHEFFRDYSIAVLYYKRAVQWNPYTPYPARYRAAKLLDYKLFDRVQALKLYRESLEKETEYHNYSEKIKQRISELAPEPNSLSIK
jgi:tetratricopeptide (TPR) repeat protein